MINLFHRLKASLVGELHLFTVTIFTVAIVLLMSLGVPLSEAAPPGWKLTWSDEFEGNTLDASQWDAIDWDTPHNNERQAYIASQVAVANGNLILKAENTPLAGKAYRSGKVESIYAQQYGRWEVRAKLPGTKGTWPAIWLLPDTNLYPWPTEGEIDIMENRGHQAELTSSAYHWGADVAGHDFVWNEQKTTNSGTAQNYHDEFHVYAVEWDKKKMRFFVDDVHYHTVSNADTRGFLSSQTAPMEVNLNVAVGGKFLDAEQPDETSVWPQTMEIDYVRVYERDSSPPAIGFRNGSFEENDGSLAGWSTFGNSLPNIQTHHEVPAAEGFKALKLFGQFQAGVTTYSGVSQGIRVSAGDNISATAKAYIQSLDDLVGTNSVEMKFDFFSDFGAQYGQEDYISSSGIQIANAETANDVWQTHTLEARVPAGAVEARLVFVFVQPEAEGGSVYIDNVSFVNLDSENKSAELKKPSFRKQFDEGKQLSASHSSRRIQKQLTSEAK